MHSLFLYFLSSLFFFLLPPPAASSHPHWFGVRFFRAGPVSFRQIQPCDNPRHAARTAPSAPSALRLGSAARGLCRFVWNCQNAGNFNVTASLDVTGLRTCRIHLRTVNRIHLALLMWSCVKDRFPPSQFTQTCFRTVYILLPASLNFVSTAIWTDTENFLFILFFLLCTHTDVTQSQICVKSALIVRIFSYWGWAIFVSNSLECVCSPLSLPSLFPLHICLRGFLCVSVCLYAPKCDVSVCYCVCSSERNLCYLLLMQLIMAHWNQSPSRPGQMACSACLKWLRSSALGGQTANVPTRRKNAIDPDSPKNNQINAFCPLSAPAFWSVRLKRRQEKVPESSEKLIISLLPYVSACISEQPGSPASLLLNVRSSLREEFIFPRLDEHNGTLCIISGCAFELWNWCQR